MASVRSRADTGMLFLDFQYRGERCREQTLLPNTSKNKKKLQVILDRIVAEITLGTFEYGTYFPNSKHVAKFSAAEQQQKNAKLGASATLVFSDWADTWLAENKVRWRLATLESNTGTINKHLRPFFGEKALSEISKSDVLRFRSHLATLPGKAAGSTLSPKTINHTIGVLSMLMEEGADRFGGDNPCKTIKRLRQPRHDIHPFTLEEVRKILDSIRPDFRDYYLVRFFTGMRTGEIHGLRWKHVDLGRREILIRETYTKGRFEYTKTDGSQREIQMSQPVCEALTNRREMLGPLAEELVFPNGNGEPINVQNVTNRVWYPLLRHLGLDKRRPYQCRHTAATLWLASGESPEWIARQLGHTTTEMLFKTYSRYVPNLTRQDGSAFERVLAAEGLTTLTTPTTTEQTQ